MAPLMTSDEATAAIHELYTILAARADDDAQRSQETTTAEEAGTATAVKTAAVGTAPSALTLITLILVVLIAAAILICSRAGNGFDAYVDEILRRRDEVTTRLLGRSGGIRDGSGRKKRKVSGPIDGEDVEMATLAVGSTSAADSEGIHWHGSNLLNTSWGWMG